MATTVLQSQANTSKFFMDPREEPTPPSSEPADAWLHGYGARFDADHAKKMKAYDPHWKPGKQRQPSGFYNDSMPKPVDPNAAPKPKFAGRGGLEDIGYFPAQLRPDMKFGQPITMKERCRPQAPETPPQSAESSFDSASTLPLFLSAENRIQFAGAEEDEEILRLSKSLSTSATDVLRHGLTKLNNDLPMVTSHWKPNVTSSECLICKTTFTFFFRRHHCRSCGQIICSSCSQKTVPLDQNAHYHPDGQQSKACDRCVKDYQVFEKLLAYSSSQDKGQAKPAEFAKEPRYAGGTNVKPRGRKEGMSQAEFDTYPHSAGYHWSTF